MLMHGKTPQVNYHAYEPKFTRDWYLKTYRRREAQWAEVVADALTVDSLWHQGEARVPKIVMEYNRGGAYPEKTLRENPLAFAMQNTKANNGICYSDEQIDTSTTFLDVTLDNPFFISPIGSLRALCPWAECLVAMAARDFGTAMSLSTLSGTPMEDVRAAMMTGDKTDDDNCQFWFQLYKCCGDRSARWGVERAMRSKAKAIILTIDTRRAGNRAIHASMKPMAALGSLLEGTWLERRKCLQAKMKEGSSMLYKHRAWLKDHLLDGGLMQFVNVVEDEEGNPMGFADIKTQLESSTVTFDDITWIKEIIGNDVLLIVKGVQTAKDAELAYDKGAQIVIWSNHGGRQLDGVLPGLHLLKVQKPEVDRPQLIHFMDSGVRYGRDALIALAHGAHAVGLGRVVIAGLAAGGYAGVYRALEIFRAEFRLAMDLVGVKSVAEIRERGIDLLEENLVSDTAHLPRSAF